MVGKPSIAPYWTAVNAAETDQSGTATEVESPAPGHDSASPFTTRFRPKTSCAAREAGASAKRDRDRVSFTIDECDMIFQLWCSEALYLTAGSALTPFSPVDVPHKRIQSVSGTQVPGGSGVENRPRA